jgi:hypothetical protein
MHVNKKLYLCGIISKIKLLKNGQTNFNIVIHKNETQLFFNKIGYLFFVT